MLSNTVGHCRWNLDLMALIMRRTVEVERKELVVFNGHVEMLLSSRAVASTKLCRIVSTDGLASVFSLFHGLSISSVVRNRM